MANVRYGDIDPNYSCVTGTGKCNAESANKASVRYGDIDPNASCVTGTEKCVEESANKAPECYGNIDPNPSSMAVIARSVDKGIERVKATGMIGGVSIEELKQMLARMDTQKKR